MSPVTAGLLVALGLLPSLVWMFFFTTRIVIQNQNISSLKLF